MPHKTYSTKKIFTPGPTEVPTSVLEEITRNNIYHRSSEFKTIYRELVSSLKKIFFTESYINVLTSSGTGAMEASVLNFTNPDDKILYVNQGRFGKRWGDICKAHDIETYEVSIHAEDSVSLDNFEEDDIDKYGVIYLTHSETSTGAFTDIKIISKYIKDNSNALIVVDGISSVGALEFYMDEWEVDVCVSSSQKALMTPPGLSIVAYNERAKEKMMINNSQRYYFDLRKEFNSLEDYGFTAWTPSIGLFFGLKKACEIILDEGIENVWDRVYEIAKYSRVRAEEIGFKIFPRKPVYSLSAFSMPDKLDSGLLIDAMKNKYDIVLANGQDDLKGKIFRISHMGNFNKDDFELLFELIEKEINLLS